MKINVAAIALAAIFLVQPTRAPAATKFWKNSVTSGNWSVGNNWSVVGQAGADNGGVPVAFEPVVITHSDGTARTVTLDTNTPSLGLLYLDLTGPGTAANTLSITGNHNLTANAISVGGNNGFAFTNGRGAVNQSNGTVTISPGVDFIMAWGAGSSGTYTLSGGALVTSQSQWVGHSGTGTFNHTGGTNTLNANSIGSFFVGYNSGSNGTYNLGGTGWLDSNESEYIGHSGTGTFNQTGGSHTINGAGNNLYLGHSAGSTGTYTLSGGGLSTVNDIVVGNAGTGTFNQTGGTNFIADELYLGNVAGSTGAYTISAGSVSVANDFYAGYAGTGALTIQGTGSVSCEDLYVGYGAGGARNGAVNQTGGTVEVVDVVLGYLNNSTGAYTISAGSVSATDDFFVGFETFGSVGTLTVQGTGVVSTEKLWLADPSTLNLMGGVLRFHTFFGDLNRLNHIAGTIQLAGDRTIGSDTNISTLFGTAPIIPSGKGLAIEGTATLNQELTLDGGHFTAGGLVNAPLLDLQRGTLTLTDQEVTISSSGMFGSTLDLDDDITINVMDGITNQGLVTGDGQLGGTFANAASGELRAEPGKSLTLTGTDNTNAGRINLFGGLLEFTQDLTNNAGALISGNGSLIVESGLTNNGTINFSGAANVVGDVTNSTTGTIISSGGGPTTFHDDVTNNGEIRTSAGSFTVFFGAATGAGTYTGLGTVNFEGDLSPGSSPAAVNFAGDVVLGPESTLQIELGGTAAGTQYDQINIAGDLTLDGTLEISLTNGFTPTPGQTFDFLNGGTLAGAFSSVVLPDLPGLLWNTSQLAAGMLSVALPGDFNQDGAVDAADYTVWRDTLGSTTTLAADGNGSGTIDAGDFDVWKTNFGAGATGSASVSGAVPEPTSLALLYAAILAIRPFSRRRR